MNMTFLSYHTTTAASYPVNTDHPPHFPSSSSSSSSSSMASISPPPPHNFALSNSKFLSPYPLKGPSSPSSSSHFASHSPYPIHTHTHTHTICRCNNSDSSTPPPWHSALQDLVHTAIKTFDSFMNPRKSDSKEPLHCHDLLRTQNEAKQDLSGIKDDPDWDWDRWRKHFREVDEQERLLAVLKSQLSCAVRTEDYQYAARTKVAIAALSTNDTVGQVGSYLNKAIEEERYHDAAFIRDKAGAGLVGWWSGIPNNVKDPRGLIIQITAEHGRYVARSYSPRQLTTATGGIPLFEIFLNVNEKGEYKQQAVYLKWGGAFQVSSADSSKVSDGPSLLSSSDPNEHKGELFVSSSEDVEDVDDRGEDSDLALGLTGFQNLLRDVIPGVKVKVLKMTTPGKVDRDLISKVIEEIIEEEEEEEGEEEGEGGEEDDENGGGEEEKNGDLEILDAENRIQDDDQLRDAINLDSDPGIMENEVHNGIAVKVVVGGLVQKHSGHVPSEDFLRVPAKIEKKDRHTFSFLIQEDDNKQDSEGKKQSPRKRSKLQNESGIEHIMVDLAKFVGREKIPLKVFKEVGELIKLTLSQAQNHEQLVGTTIFNRIEINASSDPLNGLYIGAHGLYMSEVIHLKRRFGRWKEDRGGQESSNLEFYEYVEAFKITGDPHIPAGQVAFRAKVGKSYQIPHKGIIPEEFGVIARYKGQGRLAEPGFRNPRWVDGELVILDGKYIKGGPVVGFVYWAPEFHFLVFFNRLKLPQ